MDENSSGDRLDSHAFAERTSEPPDITVSLRVSAEGGYQSTYLGEAHQGEAGTDDVARSVIAFLRARSETWSEPARPSGSESGIDFEAVGPAGTFRMQITRVTPDDRYFREVAAEGHAVRHMSPEALAEVLIRAIRRKAAKIPPHVRPKVTLILDGSRFLGFDFGSTARAFHERYHAEALGFCFDDVLLLGTMRLLAMLAPPPEDDGWFPGT